MFSKKGSEWAIPPATKIAGLITFSQEMYPTEEKIDNLKKQALRLLPERIRRETDWHEKELVLKNADVYVLVDGMNDKSAEEKVALEMKI